MALGIPLDDMDRWDWLIELRAQVLASLARNPAAQCVILTCSALKHKYRDVIRIAAYNDSRVIVRFLFLHVAEHRLDSRIRGRHDHYMGANMIRSQLAVLEEPTADEWDVIVVNANGLRDETRTLIASIVRATFDSVI